MNINRTNNEELQTKASKNKDCRDYESLLVLDIGESQLETSTKDSNGVSKQKALVRNDHGVDKEISWWAKFCGDLIDDSRPISLAEDEFDNVDLVIGIGNDDGKTIADIEPSNSNFYPTHEEFNGVFGQKSQKHVKRLPNPLLRFVDNPKPRIKKSKQNFVGRPRQYPKKEYYRTKLIRKYKKVIRKILKEGNFLKIEDYNNLELTNAFKKFEDFIKTNTIYLINLAKTETGPLTEGQTK